jgi:GH18 family chitinase
MKRIIAFMIAAAVVCSVLTAQTKKIVGYYPAWLKNSYPFTMVQYENLTHICHAFVFPTASGGIDHAGWSAYPDLISEAHYNDVKVVISVGGYDLNRTPNFASMAANATARGTFVSNILNFIKTYGYDGIDLDWEYPKAADKANLVLLVKELRAAFDADGRQDLTISMAGPSADWNNGYDFDTLKDYFDWIGVMTYDFYGPWEAKAGPNSPLYTASGNTLGSVNNSYAYYTTTRKIPNDKILLGIPFYGYKYTASTWYGSKSANEGSSITYANASLLVGNKWTRKWDDVAKVPYLMNDAGTQIVSYDDVESVELKCDYVKSKGAGGVIIWAIGQDKLSNDNQPLLATIGTVLRSPSAVGEKGEAAIPSEFQLQQNYPNPFNPVAKIQYSLKEAGLASLKVYTILGQEVATLVSTMQSPGTYTVNFNAEGFSSGVYIYRLSQNNKSLTRSMIVLR